MQSNFDFNRGAIRPIQCLSDGYILVKGNYGGFLGVMIIGILVIMVSAFIPFSPLTPPLMCGMYICLFSMMRREPFNTSTLFQGFNFFGQSFLASLFVSVPIFCLSILMQAGVFVFSAYIENLQLGKKTPVEKVFPALYSFFGFLFGMILLIVAIGFLLGIVMTFVYPLIVDRKLGAFQAIKLSFRAVIGNFFGVIGLVFLGQLIILAGIMFFYIGALFVAPIIFAAWAVAYSRVFHQEVSNPVGQVNAPEQLSLSVPISGSKAGWLLTLGSIVVIGLGVTGIGILGVYAYQGISQAIEKRAEQDRQRKRNSGLTLSFQSKLDESTSPAYSSISLTNK